MDDRQRVTDLENTIIDALLAGDDPILTRLRKQYVASSVESRDFTGVGFFTHFSVSENVPRVEPRSFHIGDIQLEVTGVNGGALALLFIREGTIDFLEVATYVGEWPNKPKLVSISYHSRKPGSEDDFVLSKNRDMAVARKSWAS